MANLGQELARLGIEPIGAEWSPPLYSTFRTIESEPVGEDAAAPQDIAGEQAIVVSEPRVDEVEEASAPPLASPPAEEVLAVNDRFIMAYMDEPSRQFCLIMTGLAASDLGVTSGSTGERRPTPKILAQLALATLR